eukprot:11055571-Alexandrium_andersonii.AAC.1
MEEVHTVVGLAGEAVKSAEAEGGRKTPERGEKSFALVRRHRVVGHKGESIDPGQDGHPAM